MRAVPAGWRRRGFGHLGVHPNPPKPPRRITGASAPPPASAWNLDLLPTKVDQGPSEACVPWSRAQVIRGRLIAQGITAAPLASAELLWAMLRESEHTFPQNVGCYPADAEELLRTCGYDSDAEVPWTGLYNRAPTWRALVRAAARKLPTTDWAAIDGATDGQLLDALAGQVAGGMLPTTGGPISNDYADGNFDPTAVMGPASDSPSGIAGNHALVIAAYESLGAGKRKWLRRTSWGADFPDVWFSDEAILGSLDLSVITHAEPYG